MNSIRAFWSCRRRGQWHTQPRASASLDYAPKGNLTENRAGDAVTECGLGTVIVELPDITRSVVNRGVGTVEPFAIHAAEQR